MNYKMVEEAAAEKKCVPENVGFGKTKLRKAASQKKTSQF